MNRILDLVLGIIIGIAGSYWSDYLYLKMREGGLTPRLPFVMTDKSGKERATDVYLLPFSGFPESSAQALARALEKDTGLKVSATGAIPLPVELLNKERNQYDDNYLAPIVENSAAGLRSYTNKQVFIAILKQDMYSSAYSWNFALSGSFDNGINIVATERLIPMEAVGDVAKAEEIYGQRVYKLIKRVIGLQFYNYPRSTEHRSLMFSPVMSVLDLDNMGLAY